MNETVKIIRRHDLAEVPVYATEGASGADLKAIWYGQVMPGSTLLVLTGLSIELPIGYEAQIRSRSGLALTRSVFVLNSPGTIDRDYQGEIGVILFNAGREIFHVKPGDRIAQLVICPVVQASFALSDAPTRETIRGEGGFGSTGAA